MVEMLEVDGESASGPTGDAAVPAERRLQVLAFNEWLRVAGGKPFPQLRDMDQVAIPGFRDHSFAIRLPEGGEEGEGDPEFLFVGAHLLADCPEAGAIRTLAQVPAMTLLSRLTGHYMECVANAAPVGFEAAFVNRQGAQVSYRGILLPIADRATRIDHVWGTINCKLDHGAAAEAVPVLAPVAPPVPAVAAPAKTPAPRQPPARTRAARTAQPLPATPSPKSSRPVRTVSEERSAPVMSLDTKLAECMSIDGAIAVALVDNSSGMAIATAGNPRNIDLNLAAAGSSNVLRAKQQTLRELGLDEEIEDVLITLASQYHLIRPLTDASGKGLSVYLMLDKAKANLAMARFKLTRIEKDLTI